MAQTPLHVSSGYNNVEIVKFLLNCEGPEKVELEAKNMVGINCSFLFVLPIHNLWKFLHFVHLLLLFMGVDVVSSMGKLLCIWQQRMAAMTLHGCFLLMVLLSKPKQMCAL